MSFEPKRLKVTRAADEENKDRVMVATGVEFPSGEVVIEWRRGAFPKGERTEHPTQSHYGSLDDCEQATGGEVEIVDDPNEFTRASELNR